MNRHGSEAVVMMFDEENVEYEEFYIETIDENGDFVDVLHRQPIRARRMEEEVIPSPTPSTSQPKLQQKAKKKPAGPLTSYNLFYKRNAEEAQRKNPQIRGKEFPSFISAWWKSLTRDEKSSYEKEAAALKQKFMEEHPEYRRASSAPTASKASKTPRAPRVPEAPKAARTPKSPKSPKPEKPEIKRPLNAFMMYVNFRRHNLREGDSNLKLVARTKRYGEEWKSFTEEQRKPYVNEANRLAEEHRLKHPELRKDRKLAMKKARDDAKAQAATVETPPPAKKLVRISNPNHDLQNIQPTFYASKDFPWTEVYKTLGLDPKDLL